MSDLKLVGLCGSLRRESTNLMLLKEAGRVFGASDFVIGDIDFPLYNEDVENGDGIPEKVQTLSEQIAAADAVILYARNFVPSWAGAIAIDLLPMVLVFILAITHAAIRQGREGAGVEDTLTLAELRAAVTALREVEAVAGPPAAPPVPATPRPEAEEVTPLKGKSA